jgi:hypothetical protein
MSDTPRTDAARGFHDMDTAVSAEDMAQLESELVAAIQISAKYENRYFKTIAELADMKARAEKAEADTARLDWLSVSDVWLDIPATGAFTPETMRAAIDLAMTTEANK